MSAPEPSVTVENMIRFIEEGRSHLDEFLKGLTAIEKDRQGTITRWGIKDHVAHLAIWAQGIAALLRREDRWQAMRLEEAFVSDETTSEEDINAMIYLNHKRLDYDAAYSLFNLAHREVISALQALTDADLLRPYSHFQPWADAEDDEPPIWPRIVGNTFGHYEEHLPWMQTARTCDPTRALSVHHIAVVVPNIQAQLGFWRDALGLPVTDEREVEQEQVRVAFLDAGEAHIELVEPTTPDSGTGRYLEKHGSGMHHICFEVPDIDAAMTTLNAHQVRLITPAAQERDERRYVFIHPQSTGGVLVELYERR